MPGPEGPAWHIAIENVKRTPPGGPTVCDLSPHIRMTMDHIGPLLETVVREPSQTPFDPAAWNAVQLPWKYQHRSTLITVARSTGGEAPFDDDMVGGLACFWKEEGVSVSYRPVQRPKAVGAIVIVRNEPLVGHHASEGGEVHQYLYGSCNLVVASLRLAVCRARHPQGWPPPAGAGSTPVGVS